jgi:beta-xylosidase
MLKAAMLWNEPNNLSHWDYTIDPQWAIFAQMARWAHQAIKAEAPDVTTVLGGVAPVDPTFVDLMMRRHGLEEVLDVVAMHAFPFDWHLWQIEEWPEKVAELRAVTNKPIWATEVGVSSFGSEEVQAVGLRRTYELVSSLVEQVFWYSLFDLHLERGATTRHKEAEGSAYYRHFFFGLLTHDGQPKPALRAFPSDPRFGIVQWLYFGERDLVDATARWLKDLGVTAIRTGMSWADSHRPDALPFFDYVMRKLEPFDVTLTFCFTPASRGIRPHHTSPPVDPGEFAHFCAEMVRRYK